MCRKIIVMVVMVDSTKVMAVHRGHSQAIVMHRAHEGTREVMRSLAMSWGCIREAMEVSSHVMGVYKGDHGGI